MALPMGILMSGKYYAALKSRVIINKRHYCNLDDTCTDSPSSKIQNNIANKVALITGGASGIGLTIAREFLKNNIRGVTIADVDADVGDSAVLGLQNEFGPKKVIFSHTDVTQFDQFEDSMRCTVETFRNFDILVNNAGYLDDKRWERMIQINVNGVINGCILAMETFIPKHKSSEFGIIVNVASIAGLQAIPTIPFYVSTKHALIGLGKCLSDELHYNATKARVITICPGYYETPMTGGYMRGRTFTERAEKTNETLMSKSDFPMQKVDILGNSIVPIMNRSKNGSVWVIDYQNVSEVDIPQIKDLKKIQTIAN